MAANDRLERHAGHLFVLIFLVLTAGIVLGGFFYYRSYERHFRIQVEHQLSAIADLKVSELAHWRTERLGDGSVFYDNPNFAEQVRQYLDTPEDGNAREKLLTWISKVQVAYAYDRVFLVDTQGVARLAVPDSAEPVCDYLLEQMPAVLKSGQVTFLDLHRDGPGGTIHLSVLVPIREPLPSGKPLGILVLHIDPKTYLYPFINRWTAPSETAETLIVRRDSNDALFLNELRFNKNAALTLRIPLDQTNTPAVAAVLGHEGLMEGMDYRGERVVSVTRSVPDSPWFLVARMDSAEVYAPIRQRLWLLIVFGSVLLFGAMGGMGLVWRQQRLRFYQQQYEAAEALRQSEEFNRRIIESSTDCIKVLDLDANLLSMSEGGQRLLEISDITRYLNSCWIFFWKPEDQTRVREAVDAARNGGEGRFQAFCPSEAGNPRWWDVIVTPICDADGAVQRLLSISRDISAQKQGEEMLRETKEYLENLITYANAPIIVWDRHFKISRFNHAFEAITGRRAEEVLGESLAILFPPDQVQDSMELIRKTVTGPRWETVDIAILHVDGSIRSVLWNSATILAADGKMPLATIAQGQDVTARKRAEKAMRVISAHQDALLAAIPDIVMEVDQNKVYTWVNQPGIEFFGEDVIGKQAADYFEGEQDVYKVVQPIFNGDNETIYLESWQRRKDGEKRLLAWWCKALKDSSGNVTGALSSARDITDRIRAEEALRASEIRYRRLFESSKDGILILDADTGAVVDINPFLIELLGFSREDTLGKKIWDMGFLKDVIANEDNFQELQQQEYIRYEDMALETASGQRIEVEFISNVYLVGQKKVIQCNIRDITDRVQAEAAIALHNMRLAVMLEIHEKMNVPQQELLELCMEGTLKTVQSSLSFIGLMDESESVLTVHTWSRDTMRDCAVADKPLQFVISESGVWADCVRQRRAIIINDYDAPLPGKKGCPDGHVKLKRLLCVPVFEGPRIVAVAAVANKEDPYDQEDAAALTALMNKMWEILRYQRAEEALRVQAAIAAILLTVSDEEMYARVLEVVLEVFESPFGVFGYIDEQGALVVPTMTRTVWSECEVADKTIVFPYSTWGDSVWPTALREKRTICVNEPSTRIPKGHIAISRNISHPLIHRNKVVGLLQIANKKTNYTDKDIRLLQAIGDAIAPVLDARIQREQKEQQLRGVLADLERSNKELEQFAYVASHDLQEPLRMVASYTQLLAGHYEGQMDEKAKKYIDYAVDGAVRMQNLINDLLAYSRVGTRGASFRVVDSHAALGLALVNLQGAIQESGAIVTNDNLPKVYGDETQLAQLFQNLIGNAIKFHGTETPHVHISVKMQGHIAEFCVRDNGIGIDLRHADRVFQLFQRLHTRAEYPGTGIGLALCKRIVERHGGKIWFDSEPGKGAYFHFTVSTSK